MTDKYMYITKGFIQGKATDELSGCKDDFPHLVWQLQLYFYLMKPLNYTENYFGYSYL